LTVIGQFLVTYDLILYYRTGIKP